MIGYFPEPYPDELFYSLCARFGDRMQYPSQFAVVRTLFSTTTVITTVVDLPQYLARFVDALPPGHPCKSTDRIIDDHTLLPFYAPFLPAERLKRIRDSMLRDKGPDPSSLLGLQPMV